jgi:hypothetical protein
MQRSHSSSRLPLVVLVAAPLFQEAAPIDGVGPELRRVALAGERAPGTPAGVVFAEFGGVPGAGDDFAPRIDAAGAVVFHAVLAGPGTTGVGLADGNALGVWRSAGAADALVARQDFPAPGTEPGVELMGFLSALDTRAPVVAGGRAAFLGGLRGPGIDGSDLTNALGVWREGPSGLELAVRNGASAPGAPAGSVFRLLDVPVLAPNGRLAFNGLWRAPGDAPAVLVPNQEGIWSDRAGALAAVVLAGSRAPGTPDGVVFRQSTSTAIGGAFRSWDASALTLRVAVHGNLGGPGVDDLDDEGVWVERAGGLVRLAREGDLAPGAGTGVRFGIPSGIDAFGDVLPVRTSAGGAAFFGARLAGPDVPFMRSLWTDRAGTLELVARGTLPLAGSASGDPAPGFGPGWTFSVLARYDVDGAGAVALSGFATFQLDFDEQLAGVWWERSGPLQRVAREGDPAPGLGAGVALAGLNQFLSLADGGPLFFLATLAGAGVSAANDLALYAVERTGPVRLLLREGASLDVAGDGSDVRVLARILPGDAGAGGELPLELGFSDGSSGVFVARGDGTPGSVRRR